MTIKDIAKLTGVSVASVSRSLDPKHAHKVSPKLRAKILETCEKMQYYPNIHTTRIFARRANTIAVLMPQGGILPSGSTIISGGMDDSLSASIAGAEIEASMNSIYVLLLSVTPEFIKNKEYLKIFRSKLVDGILIWGWTNEESYVADIKKEGIPCVIMQTTVSDASVSSVVAQNHEGTTTLIDYVLDKGHTKISEVSPAMTASAGLERHLGVIKALGSRELKLAYSSSTHGFSFKEGYQAAKEILHHRPDTTCIIGSNDLAALGVIKAATELGLKVPEQLSVTGADGLDMHGLINLTSYITPGYDIGRKAMRLLLKLIDGEETGVSQIRLPVQFIPGNTVHDLNRH